MSVRSAARRPARDFSIAIAALATLAIGCGSPTSASSPSSTGGAATSTSTGGASTGGTSTGGAPIGGGGAGGHTSTGPVDFCKGCSLVAGCTTFASAALKEVSGIVPSALHDGVYFVHNDSGDTARFYATSCAGDDLGVFELDGASAVDWEDVERGPCGASTCLFFGDTGDNLETRTSYTVYRTDEPTVIGAGTHKVASVAYPFVYPDGSHDAETLLIHPITGEMVIVTKLKQAGKSGIYAFPTPLTPGVQATLVKVGEVAAPSGSVRITAGDVHPKAEGILLRTYTSLFFYPMTPAQTIEAALTGAPCDVPVMLELQGEAVAFTAAGTAYVTASEMSGQSLHFVTCQ